jgi:hypothetical protein
LSVSSVTLGYVEVTAADLARVPAENLRVPRAEFGVVWAAAERQAGAEAARGVTDWYAGGVVVTCRWLAGAVTTDQTGRREPTYSPATDRSVFAYEESIEAEYLIAERLDISRPDLIEHRPGWCEAIRATLRWAWRHSGPPPLDMASVRAAG